MIIIIVIVISRVKHIYIFIIYTTDYCISVILKYISFHFVYIYLFMLFSLWLFWRCISLCNSRFVKWHLNNNNNNKKLVLFIWSLFCLHHLFYAYLNRYICVCLNTLQQQQRTFNLFSLCVFQMYKSVMKYFHRYYLWWKMNICSLL